MENKSNKSHQDGEEPEKTEIMESQAVMTESKHQDKDIDKLSKKEKFGGKNVGQLVAPAEHLEVISQSFGQKEVEKVDRRKEGIEKERNKSDEEKLPNEMTVQNILAKEIMDTPKPESLVVYEKTGDNAPTSKDKITVLSCPINTEGSSDSGVKENDKSTTAQNRVILPSELSVFGPEIHIETSSTSKTVYLQQDCVMSVSPQKDEKTLISLDQSLLSSSRSIEPLSPEKGIQPGNACLSEEEKTRLQFISEQLNILNKESGKLATPIYKSDREKRLERKRKCKLRRAIIKKRKLRPKKLHRKEPGSQQTEDLLPLLSNLDPGTAIDGCLEISKFSSEQQIDKALEENARKNNLTAVNVKSILHKVITNEHVVAMMKNTLKEDEGSDEDKIEAVYEPKMTRSKIKQVLEKGVVPQTWPLHSVKKSSSHMSFLDMPFSDDEEDDEYNPEKDSEEVQDSDDDAENLLSSQMSVPSMSVMPKKEAVVECEENSPSPSSKLVVDEEPKEDENDGETIAKRTRSKFPLHDTSLLELEASFVAPDITPDMYDTECDDKEWREFLGCLQKNEDIEDTTETNDDEMNDPEYNYLAEAEHEELDLEDFRDDRSVRVTKKELHELLDELLEDDIFGLDEYNASQKQLDLPLTDEKNCLQFSSVTSADVMSVSPEELITIVEHMKKHVQLLTQLVVLTRSNLDYNNETTACSRLLNELNTLAKASPLKNKSVFNACNLVGALDIIDQTTSAAFLEEDKKLKQNKGTKRCLPHLTASQKHLLWNSPVFMYVNLLPEYDFPKISHLNKKIFTNAEDNLLAMGLEQFHSFNSTMKFKLIRQLLLPTKTDGQIKIRIKNVCSKRESDNNIKYVKLHKKLPDCLTPPRKACLTEMKAGKDQMLNGTETMPHWCLALLQPSHKMTGRSRPKRVDSKKAVRKISPGRVKEDGEQHFQETNTPTDTETENRPNVKSNHVISVSQFMANIEATESKKDLDNVAQKNSFIPTTCVTPSILIISKPSQSMTNMTGKTAECHMKVVFGSNPSAGSGAQLFKSNPVDVMATVAQYLSSPHGSKMQCAQETTPKKFSSSPSKYKMLVPKPMKDSPANPVSPLLEKKKSPRRRLLQQKALAIRPKGLYINTYVSPTKRAACGLSRRAKKCQNQKQVGCMKPGPRTILPKPFPSDTNCYPLGVVSRLESKLSDHLRNNSAKKPLEDCTNTPFVDKQQTVDKLGGCEDVRSSLENHVCEEVASENEDVGVSAGSQDESQNEYDSQNEDDDHLAQLLEASTTISCLTSRFNPKKASIRDTRSKAQKRKDMTLAILAPNLIEGDPLRDYRDTMFAQAYLNRVKKTLHDKVSLYERFLKLLFEFGKSDQSPTTLFNNVSELLKDYPSLIHDFTGFLSLEHALECGCYMTTLEFNKARTFLRKLEVHFEKHPSQFQKILRTFTEWQKKPTAAFEELQEHIQPMLRGQQHLLEEFSLFFGNERPPESAMTDFEEMTLEDSDQDDNVKTVKFEEVVLPDVDEPYGTEQCPCRCHHDQNDVKLLEKTKHCITCGLKVINGKFYFKNSGKCLRPAKIIFHEPIYLSNNITDELSYELYEGDYDDDNDEVVEYKHKEVRKSGSPKISDKNIPALKTDRIIKPCRRRLQLKKPKLQGRFMALNELVESNDKLCDQQENGSIQENTDGGVQHEESMLPIEGKEKHPWEKWCTQREEKDMGKTAVLEAQCSRQLDQKQVSEANLKVTEHPQSVVLEAPRTLSANDDDVWKMQTMYSTAVATSKNSVLRTQVQEEMETAVLHSSDLQNEPSGALLMFSLENSNNSGSGDILAKALKAACISQTSGDSSEDQSLQALLQTPSMVHLLNSVSQSPRKFGMISETAPLANSTTTHSSLVPGSVGSGQAQDNSSSLTPTIKKLSVYDYVSTERKQQKMGKTSDASSRKRSQTQQTRSPPASEVDEWNRDIDKIILEMCKEHGPTSHAFEYISTILHRKTPQQIADRFHNLMNLYTEVETSVADT